jgi:hypothetical protein
MTGPRLLTIMGSGETAPTMVKVHRGILERVGAPAVLLDTPYGFQENADDISLRAQQYFAQSVGHPMEVASYRSSSVAAVVAATAMAKVESAHFVFAGPGSPTYALRHWADTPLPLLLAAKLASGGAVTFASAAALTLGIATVPVYEVYKAGEPPAWREGLDLLGAATGLRAAVIPHFDNAEGGHHDTRYCYLGERRLSRLEDELPPDAFVLGVDEHTALVLDLEAGSADVLGNGGVTVRSGGRTTVFTAGSSLLIEDLGSAARGQVASPRHSAAEPPPAASEAKAVSPLLAEAARWESEFDAALARGDIPAAVNAILELEGALTAWSADTTQSDEPDRVRAILHSMIVRLGEVAVTGARDPRAVVEPFVAVVLEARAAARSARDWARSDELRDRLAAAGVEVRDTPAGQEWLLTGEPVPGPE